ncbi:AfsA-related hotdog domain-containing protein [Alcaligenes aquatilis]|uniref:A-factor biosynthesis hotdog domain-containing protein n=2 Tax=Alcaligenes TaxID=507 RepID=A0A3G2HQY3_9BURK|nr:AfsA-related hotdog domain-containing protein [Alcaligenes aquatilis]AYN19532.1 hypothetical protein D3M96_02660 [Alcaligenes aquatilis]
MRVVIVVPEAFENFSKNENCISYSEALSLLKGDEAALIPMQGCMFIAGLGLGELQIDHIECLAARRGLKHEFKHWREWQVSTTADRALCHKHVPENVLISRPRKESETLYSADLHLNSNNELMLDHLTGQHVQGMVLTEACRQMFLAVTEEFFLQDYKTKKRYFVIETMAMRFTSFAFPLPAHIEYKVINKDSRKAHKRGFHVNMEVFQCSKPVCGMEVKFTVFDDVYITVKENELAAQTLMYCIDQFRIKNGFHGSTKPLESQVSAE